MYVIQFEKKKHNVHMQDWLKSNSVRVPHVHDFFVRMLNSLDIYYVMVADFDAAFPKSRVRKHKIRGVMVGGNEGDYFKVSDFLKGTDNDDTKRIYTRYLSVLNVIYKWPLLKTHVKTNTIKQTIDKPEFDMNDGNHLIYAMEWLQWYIATNKQQDTEKTKFVENIKPLFDFYTKDKNHNVLFLFKPSSFLTSLLTMTLKKELSIRMQSSNTPKTPSQDDNKNEFYYYDTSKENSTLVLTDYSDSFGISFKKKYDEIKNELQLQTHDPKRYHIIHSSDKKIFLSNFFGVYAAFFEVTVGDNKHYICGIINDDNKQMIYDSYYGIECECQWKELNFEAYKILKTKETPEPTIRLDAYVVYSIRPVLVNVIEFIHQALKDVQQKIESAVKESNTDTAVSHISKAKKIFEDAYDMFNGSIYKLNINLDQLNHKLDIVKQALNYADGKLKEQTQTISTINSSVVSPLQKAIKEALTEIQKLKNLKTNTLQPQATQTQTLCI